MEKIDLIKDTIDKKDIELLIEWLKTEPILTKNKLTIEFEEIFSKYQNKKYSVYLNSGSSANLLMIYSLILSGRLKNKKIIVPAVSWSTTVAPSLQFGLEPILCDADSETLGLDIIHLENLIKKHEPSVVMLVNVLGFPNKMKEIQELCKKHDIILIEDSCESLGSTYDGVKTGSFGLMSSFSFYFGHHLSVSPNTPIPYLDEYNNFNLDSIENIYNKYNYNINNIKVISFNNKYNTLYKTPSHIIRHKLGNKKLFEINLENNRKVEITEDHSIFSYDKNNFNIIEKKGENIKIGDYIVVPNKIPRPEIKKELNFLNFCKKRNDFISINYNENDFNNIKFKWNSQENKNKFTWKKRNKLPLEYLTTITENLKIAKKNTPKNKFIPYKYKIDEKLTRLIGYYLAEGSYKKSGLSFSFNINEIKYINDVKNIITDIFHLETYDVIDKINNSHTVCVSSETLLIFFKDFLKIKSGAKNKRIPSFIFHSEDDYIKSFLYGYFVGDGTIIDNNRMSVTSTSKNLINDISYLFNLLGLNGTISKTNEKDIIIKNKKTKRNDQFKFIISNAYFENKKLNVNQKNKKLTFDINHFSKRKNDYVSYKCIDYINNFKNEFEKNKNLKKFINSDLMLLKVKNIKEIQNNELYVYDFSVPELENFIGGWQPICLHNSTIEGGMVTTDDYELYSILKSIRSHGWNRDLEEPFKSKIKEDFETDDFTDLYKFYFPGFNLRSTDLQAFIGINQMKKVDTVTNIRRYNYFYYNELIKNDYWKIKDFPNTYISNFAYPIIHPNKLKIAEELKKANVESRPLICGSIGHQPFWIKKYGKTNLPFADVVDKYGLYVPNHPEMGLKEVEYICNIINKNI